MRVHQQRPDDEALRSAPMEDARVVTQALRALVNSRTSLGLVEVLRHEIEWRLRCFDPAIARGSAWEVLLAVWHAERASRGAFLADVAAECGIEPGLVRRQLDALHEAGLVTRMRSRRDARFVQVTVSVRGRRLFLKYLRGLKSVVER